MSKALTRAARLREIENLLFRNPHGLRITEIATACKVNRRTIYRDIDLLEDANVPIWQDHGRYGIIRDQYLATIRLKFQEAVALYIATRLLARHADEHNPHVVSALAKLSTAFPDPLSDQINRTAESVKTQPVNPSFIHALEQIALCWAESRKVEILYRSAGSSEPKQRLLSPYTLEPSSTGGLYVVGHDEASNDIRTFKLERVEAAHQTNTSFTIPDTFDPKSYFADAWGIMPGNITTDIQLRFSPNAAPYIKERIWHPSQVIIDGPANTIDLFLTLGDTREIQPWIRSWGAEVEVIKPKYLRDKITNDIKKLVSMYE